MTDCRRPCILVTAFMPFGGDAVNPTETILSRLPNAFRNFSVKKLLLPVEFERCVRIALESIDRLSPAAVLMLGQAGGRSAVTPERVAINIMDATIPDNAGYMPVDMPICDEGDAALFSTLPIKRIVNSVNKNGLPCAVSNSAGTYVCNTLMYGVLNALKDIKNAPLAGFIHVPYSCEQVEGNANRKSVPFMRMDDMQAAIEIAIEATIDEVLSCDTAAEE